MISFYQLMFFILICFLVFGDLQGVIKKIKKMFSKKKKKSS